jgi:hypothetical protein
VDNNKYLKWLDKTGTSRANIIALDNNNNVNINSAYGDMRINNNNPGSFTFINNDNSGGNVIVGTHLGIGFNSTENMNANLTLVKNAYIGLNTTSGTSDGYLGLSSSSDLSNINGSRVLMYGNEHTNYPGNIHFYSGNVTNGNINLYTGNDSLKMQVLQNGTFNFIPDGITTRLSITDISSTFTNDIMISSTTESHNATTGAVQIRGGIGILGNLYVDGTISLNSATGNINFDSTQLSTSYTSGAIFLSGGMGISASVNASSATAGGALSIAGGAAFGKDVYIGGKLTITDTTPSSSSQTGSLIVYGGIGVNNSILSRADASQIQIAPKTSGLTTEILFYSTNNFTSTATTNSSWKIGQNVNSIGSGKFGLSNSDCGIVFSASYDGSIDIRSNVTISNTQNASSEDNGGAFTVRGGAAFKKDVFIGGAITLAGGGTISGGGGSSDFAYLNLTSTDNAINLSTGSLVSIGGITVQADGEAISVTEGGSILTAGGVSIGKSLFIGGPILKIPTGTTIERPDPADLGYIRYNVTTSQFEGFGPGGAWGSLGGVVDIAQTTKVLASSNPSVTDGNLYFYTVGSERMRINSAGNIGIGTTSPTQRLDINGGLRVDGITTNNLLSNTSTFGSINVTGECIISVGVTAGSLNVTNEAIINLGITTGSLNVTGGAILNLGITTGSINVTGGAILNLGITTGSLNVTGECILQDSVTAGSIYVTGQSTLNGDVQMINSVSIGSHLNVNGNGLFTGDLTINGIISGGAQTGSTFAYMTLTSTDDAINLSTGSLLTYGGITIQSPTDAQSVTNGGSLLTDGGAAIRKRLFVGEDLIVSKNSSSKTINVLSTENATGVGTGGSLTVFGGASITKDIYVGGTVTSSSDIRLKTNIEEFDNSHILDKIENLRTIRYNYIDDESNTPYVGFIAQDFVEEFPDFVRCPDGGYYSLDYQKISVILMECVKELKREVKFLKTELQELKPVRKRIIKGRKIIPFDVQETRQLDGGPGTYPDPDTGLF